MSGVEPGPSLYLPARITKQPTITRSGWTVSNNFRGNITAPASNPLGGSEAAKERGRLRPAQPALSQDAQDLIEAAALARHSVTTPVPTQSALA